MLLQKCKKKLNYVAVYIKDEQLFLSKNFELVMSPPLTKRHFTKNWQKALFWQERTEISACMNERLEAAKNKGLIDDYEIGIYSFTLR